MEMFELLRLISIELGLCLASDELDKIKEAAIALSKQYTSENMEIGILCYAIECVVMLAEEKHGINTNKEEEKNGNEVNED